MRALLVIDDPITVDVIAFYLQREGFTTLAVWDGQTALERLQSDSPELILLDVKSLSEDTVRLLQSLRARSDTPIIILSNCTTEAEIVRSLQLGADDIIIKPFSPRVMLARITALLRRSSPLQTNTALLEVGKLILDCSRREVWWDQARVARLTRRECRLLEILIRNSDHVLSCDMLIKHIWGDSQGDRLGLKKLVSLLRHKIGSDLTLPVHIETRRGVGYRLVTTQPKSSGDHAKNRPVIESFG